MVRSKVGGLKAREEQPHEAKFSSSGNGKQLALFWFTVKRKPNIEWRFRQN
jgi:hypothetical protein